jgi:hypothetical protein
MIEVPQEVQEILKSDSTHKEFVVHFPNGECPDITNGNIVSESVKFEESICSQQQFKYGLAEASALEFEFVDKFYPAGQQFPALEDIFPKEMTGDVTVQRADGGSFNVSFRYWAEDYPNRIYSGSISPDIVVQTLSDARARISATIGSAYTGRIIYSCLPFTPNPNYPVIVVTEGGEIVTEDKAESSYKYGNIKGMEIEAGINITIDPPIVVKKQDPSLENVFPRAIDKLKVPNVGITKQYEEGHADIVFSTYNSHNVKFTYSISNCFPSGPKESYYNIDDVWYDIWGYFQDEMQERPETIYYTIVPTDTGYLDIYEDIEDEVTVISRFVNETISTYTIPYGVFKVDSCPRNHGAMTHRKVTAYTRSVTTNDDLPGFEKYKLQTAGWKTSALTYRSDDLPRAWFRKLDDENIEIFFANEGRWERTSSDIPLDTHGEFFNGIEEDLQVGQYTTPSGQTGKLYLAVAGETVEGWSITGGVYRYYPLGYIRRHHTTYKEAETNLWPAVRDKFEEFTQEVTWYSSYTFDYDKVKKAIKTAVDKYLSRVKLYEYKEKTVSGSVIPVAVREYWGNESAEYLVFPNEEFSLHNKIDLYRATQLAIVAEATPHSTYSAYINITPDFDTYSFQYLFNVDQMFSINSTLDTKKSGSLQRYYYYNSYSYKALLDGYLDLTADFARPSRYGDIRPIELTDEYPYRITPSDYSECWWDEYTVEPIGAIKYKFTQNGKETEVTYTIGDGTSVYDMGSNAFIDALANKSVDIINALLDQYFIPKLQYIRFVPADLTMRALPFLEAGDCLEIEAEDGTIIKTYIMHQTIDGIQSLEADISSVDGSIIETDTNSEIEEETT